MENLVNLRAAIRRQTSPGSLALLVMAMVLFAPRTWDFIRGEPWINNQLSVIEKTDGRLIVEDKIQTHDEVQGLRANTVETKDSSVICARDHRNSWQRQRNRFWRFEAFAGCTKPSEPFRVCSFYTLSSNSGRLNRFGPFCSEYMTPAKQES